MYRHPLARFNFTTYDVRRSQDVINPRTEHRDIMLLREKEPLENNANESEAHPYLYGRVLGMYHVNAVYTGPGATNFRPKRIDFLWVRWFQYNGASVTWEESWLDSLSFPPVDEMGAFGFVDPSDVIRGCHVIPAFVRGQVYTEGDGLSPCANDVEDWIAYHVNRLV